MSSLTSRYLSLGLALALLALSFVGAECDPQSTDEIALLRTTTAPPTRTAQIREEDEQGTPATITLSRGVVLAARCWDSCDFTCELPETLVLDSSILALRTVNRIDRSVPELALVAVRPGFTNLTITTTCASKTYRVEVLDD